jgi:PEGA domain
MGQDAPRNDVNPDDGLLDFGSEAPNTALDKKESDVAFNRNEPDAVLDGSDSVVIVDSREQDVAFGSKEPDSAIGRKNLEFAFNRQERDITSGTRKLDIQPDAHELPLHAPSVQPFVRYTAVPVVHKSARPNIGIALLMLVSIAALAWSGRSLMEMRRDAGTSGAQIQNASRPTPTVPLEAPTNVLPPAPDPQPPATHVPAETATHSEPATAIATPSEAPGAKAPDAPRAERPVRQAERLPINADANAAGGLFAITRPLGAQVFLDNKLIGTTPFFMSQLSSGSHEVRLELPGFRTYSSSIQVEPDRRFRLAVQLEETR